MAKLSRRISITSRTLRPQLVAAFCLMSVIPILALLNFIFPSFLPQTSVVIIVVTVVAMALFGFVLMKRIIDPIIALSSEAKVIASGELTRKINVVRNDEIGELGNALNQLTQHIRNNMDELKIYGERTKDINVKINKQVFALNGLLQIGNLISKGASLKEVFEMSVMRLIQTADSSFAFVILEKEKSYEVVSQYGLGGGVAEAVPRHAYLMKDLIDGKAPLVIDKASSGKTAAAWRDLLGVKAVILAPILAHWKAAGIVGFGSQRDDFECGAEEGELLVIFAKQLAIAVENDFLAQKVRDLEVKDSLTDLYNKRYMVSRLQEEILRAISQQKPCSYIGVKVGNLKELQARWGDLVADNIVIKTAGLLKDFGGELDRVGRLEADEFGLIFPGKNKRQAQELVSRIEDKIRQVFAGEDPHRRPQTRLGVVENPIDGGDAASLLDKVNGFFDIGGKGPQDHVFSQKG